MGRSPPPARQPDRPVAGRTRRPVAGTGAALTPHQPHCRNGGPAASWVGHPAVSFGFTEPLWAFWQQCGFRLARIGSQREASSGCYAAMALLPLSGAGHALAQQAALRFNRDWPWLAARVDLPLPQANHVSQTLDDEDWRELAGFAFAHRPLEASLGALQRLLLHSALPLPALRAHLQQGQEVASLCAHFSLPGRKALLVRWRQETANALAACDPAACRHVQAWATAWPDV